MTKQQAKKEVKLGSLLWGKGKQGLLLKVVELDKESDSCRGIVLDRYTYEEVPAYKGQSFHVPLAHVAKHYELKQ
jgi:hypothetical protein